MSDAQKPIPSPAPEPEDKNSPRPQPKLAPPPQLGTDEGHGPGPRLRDLDKEIESELEAAMGGLTAKELYGEPAKGGRKPAATGPHAGKKIGKVPAVHGPDV